MQCEVVEKNIPADEKRALLAKLLAEKAKKSRAFRLSFAQQRLWFIEQVTPGSALYNIPLAIRIDGALDRDVLQQTLEVIVARHESLRTTFASGEEEPIQIIAPHAVSSISYIDLATRADGAREAELNQLLVQEANRPFDLTRDLMLRATLFRLGPEEHMLLINMHHIASDEWSLRVFFREFAALYRAFAAGENSPLAELPIQYSDFAQWQRKFLQGETLEKQLAYWKKQLGGRLHAIELPVDRPRPGARTHRGASESLPLPDHLQAALGELSVRENVTQFMLLLAAFKALLFRCTAREELVVGTPIAGRSRSETEGLIGFFVNTLVLRTVCGSDLTFREFLHRVRETALGAYANHELPFEKIVEVLHPERTSSHTPLVNVMFALQNAGCEQFAIPGLRLSAHEIPSTTAKFDLTFVVRETSGGFVAAAEYSTELFERETVLRMLQNFQSVVENVLADPDVRISQLLPDLKDRGAQAASCRKKESDSDKATILEDDRVKQPEGRGLDESFPPAQFEGSSNLHRQLKEIWQNVLGRKSVGLRDNFFDLGGHSLLAMRLFAQMEKKLRRKIPLALLFQAPTIEQLAKAISENNEVSPTSLLVEIQPGGSRPPIFWLHNLGGGGGGGLFVYRKLAQLLGPDQPSFGITAPAEPFNRIELMASHYIEAIRAIEPVGPYFLGGYCFGGVVAFEMARQLKEQGHAVGLLAALESSLPGSTISPTRLSPAFIGHFLGNVPYLVKEIFHQSPEEIFQRVRRKGIALAKKARYAIARGEKKTPEKNSDELLDELVDMSHYPKNYKHTAQVHFDALMHYAPRAFQGRITLFRTSKPPLFDWKPEVLWKQVATGGVEVKIIPGTHETILEDPHVDELAARLRECLEEKQPRDLHVRAA